MNRTDSPIPSLKQVDLELVTVAVAPRLGGMTGWFEQIARSLTARGWRVRLVAVTDRVEVPDGAEWEILHLPMAAPRAGVLSAFDKWTRWRNLRYEWGERRPPLPRLRISDGTPGVLDFCRRLAESDRLPWVVLMGGDVFEETRGLPFASAIHRRIRRSLLAADCILVDGPDLVESLSRQGIPSERISLHFRGVDLNPFLDASRSGRNRKWFPAEGDAEPFRLVWHGRLSEHHGPERFLEVAGSVHGAVGRLAGSGEPAPELSRRLAEPAFSGWYVGSLSTTDLFDLLAEAECGVYPLKNMAGVPTVLLESMASGLPTVTLKTGAVSELIRQGENGLIAESLQGMARCIEDLRSHPDLRERVGRNALETIRRDWSTEVQTGRLEKLLEEILDR